ALYPGLAGEGNIIISEKENVLTIPKEFLLEGNKVKTQDGLVEVVTGLQNLERVEIINGIIETTEILKPEE
ncbi:MAG: efflux transporter periplasmic adaptor subunit, partial [Arenibacter sp.]